ncbi:hypothetical protein EA770_18520 [Acinetobacter baumannii]|nr:hypothetical protein EA770_18520 [Acinetobacter baumannii]
MIRPNENDLGVSIKMAYGVKSWNGGQTFVAACGSSDCTCIRALQIGKGLIVEPQFLITTIRHSKNSSVFFKENKIAKYS